MEKPDASRHGTESALPAGARAQLALRMLLRERAVLMAAEVETLLELARVEAGRFLDTDEVQNINMLLSLFERDSAVKFLASG